MICPAAGSEAAPRACAHLERALAHVLAAAPALAVLRGGGSSSDQSSSSALAALEQDADDALLRALRDAARAAAADKHPGPRGERHRAAYAAALRAKADAATLAHRFADVAALLAA